MTDPTVSLRAARDALTHPEQMADAQQQCVPCKLCGGQAAITDAGIGAGYYIRCNGKVSFNASRGCMVGDNRLGGWAYNVMEWWNRLHAQPTPPTEATEARAVSPVERAQQCMPRFYVNWHADARALLAAPTEATPPQDGLREARRTIEILRRALAWHGDPQRMATTREEWQQEIDAAITWVKANPEPDRLSFSTLAALSSEVQPAGLGSDDAVLNHLDRINRVAEAMMDDPFTDDERLRGTTQQMSRCQHYALTAIRTLANGEPA